MNFILLFAALAIFSHLSIVLCALIAALDAVFLWNSSERDQRIVAVIIFVVCLVRL